MTTFQFHYYFSLYTNKSYGHAYKKGLFMKYISALLCITLFSSTAAAQIFQCLEDDTSVFSDSPCGKNSKVIQVDAPRRNNMQLSTPNASQLADEMHSSRKKRELKNSISRQRHRLKNLKNNYADRRNELQKELDKVESVKKLYKRGGSSLQRKQLRHSEKRIREKLSDLEGRYRSNEASAKSALKESMRKQEEL